MKYCWPLVVFGAILLVIGAALPWWLALSSCTHTVHGLDCPSRYLTGLQQGGLLSALGGVILLLVALVEKGEAGSPSFALMGSIACGLLVAGAAFWKPAGSYISVSASYGLTVSVVGAVLGITGSLIRASKVGAASILTVACLFLLAYLNVSGAWPIWLGGHPVTYMPVCECFGSLQSWSEPTGCGPYLERCYASQAAIATQQTPPAWWPPGH